MSPQPSIQVAQYVRMSTDHQRYSTENQSAAILEYAAKHGMDVVRDYIDSGKSGLNIEGREGLRTMLADVQRGKPGYEAVLVYDISRWGRFQDADESAYYEHTCKRAGIRVIYVAESFDNDGSPMATIFKSVKRTMAGEYSRELSNKVFIGHCRLLGLGFHQGGMAGFGLRRRLIDHLGQFKAELGPGERKSLQTDRTVLVPGPREETETVQEIFTRFTRDRLKESRIADLLNERGAPTPIGVSWTGVSVRRVLLNERFIGRNIYNRFSTKLKSRKRKNPSNQWLRSETGTEGVVPHELWCAAQQVFIDRASQLDDATMLLLLKALAVREGWLSGMLINEQMDMPPSHAYAHRFNGLCRAYQLIGYEAGRDWRFVEENRALRRQFPAVIQTVINGLESRGAKVDRDSQSNLLTINSQWTMSVSVSRCHTASDTHQWLLRFDTALSPSVSVSVCVRMQPGAEAVKDYYIFPRVCHPMLRRLKANNGVGIDVFRFDSLEPLYEIARRTTWRQAA